jgi:hypothetical protein
VLPTVRVGSSFYYVTMQYIGNYAFQLTWADSPLPQSYATLQAWVNFLSTPRTDDFTMSGKYQGYGTVTFGGLSGTIFNGQGALADTVNATYTVPIGNVIGTFLADRLCGQQLSADTARGDSSRAPAAEGKRPESGGGIQPIAHGRSASSP